MESRVKNSFCTEGCFNPFGKFPHNPSVGDLRPVLPWMIEIIPGLNVNFKVCSGCRKRLWELPGTSNENEELDDTAVNVDEGLVQDQILVGNQDFEDRNAKNISIYIEDKGDGVTIIERMSAIYRSGAF